MHYLTIDEWRAERIAEIDRFIRDYPFGRVIMGNTLTWGFPRTDEQWDESFCSYIEMVDVYRDTPDYENVR